MAWDSAKRGVLVRESRLQAPEIILGIALPWIACWAAALVGILDGFQGGGAIRIWTWAPLAASLVAFGLPHGAVDHLEISRLADRPVASYPVLAALGGYLLLVVGVVAIWYVAPAAAFGGFIAVTWLHWGQGDLWFLDCRTNLDESSNAERWIAATLRGAIPMLGPLVWDPAAYARIYAATAGPFGGPAAPTEFWTTASRIALALLVALGATLVALRLRSPSESSRGLLFDAVELSTLVALFAFVPGIFAVGLYFCTWHGPRHVIRLAAVRTREQSPRWPGVRRTLLDSIPLTSVSLAAGIAFGFAVLSSPTEAPVGAWLGWYLVAISGLTVPHMLVVFWMDRREGLWHADAPRK